MSWKYSLPQTLTRFPKFRWRSPHSLFGLALIALTSTPVLMSPAPSHAALIRYDLELTASRIARGFGGIGIGDTFLGFFEYDDTGLAGIGTETTTITSWEVAIGNEVYSNLSTGGGLAWSDPLDGDVTLTDGLVTDLFIFAVRRVPRFGLQLVAETFRVDPGGNSLEDWHVQRFQFTPSTSIPNSGSGLPARFALPQPDQESQAVREPGSFVLFLLGIAGLGLAHVGRRLVERRSEELPDNALA